jgi:hypothetical protein
MLIQTDIVSAWLQTASHQKKQAHIEQACARNETFPSPASGYQA